MGTSVSSTGSQMSYDSTARRRSMNQYTGVYYKYVSNPNCDAGTNLDTTASFASGADDAAKKTACCSAGGTSITCSWYWANAVNTGANVDHAQTSASPVFIFLAVSVVSAMSL